MNSDSPRQVVLARFHRRRALACYAGVFLFFGLLGGYGLYEILTSGLRTAYGWLLPFMTLGSPIFLYRFAPALRSAWRDLPFIYVADGQLVVIAPSMFAVNVANVRCVAAISPAFILVTSPDGENRFGTFLADCSAAEVASRWAAFTVTTDTDRRDQCPAGEIPAGATTP